MARMKEHDVSIRKSVYLLVSLLGKCKDCRTSSIIYVKLNDEILDTVFLISFNWKKKKSFII